MPYGQTDNMQRITCSNFYILRLKMAKFHYLFHYNIRHGVIWFFSILLNMWPCSCAIITTWTIVDYEKRDARLYFRALLRYLVLQNCYNSKHPPKPLDVHNVVYRPNKFCYTKIVKYVDFKSNVQSCLVGFKTSCHHFKFHIKYDNINAQYTHLQKKLQ